MMDRIFSYFFTLGILISPSISFAGGSFVGNGGDVVVCRSEGGEITSVELLDLYEGRIHYGLTVQLNIKKTISQLLEELYSRTHHHQLRVPGKGEEKWQEFLADANFLNETELVDVPDSSHLAFPKNCRVEQIVLQLNPERKFQKRYTINKDLWDLLDSAGRASLVFHELVYKYKILEAKDLYEINSRDVRYFVALSAADRIGDAFSSQEEYLEFLKYDLWISEF